MCNNVSEESDWRIGGEIPLKEVPLRPAPDKGMFFWWMIVEYCIYIYITYNYITSYNYKTIQLYNYVTIQLYNYNDITI